jgi:hypothetical protein
VLAHTTMFRHIANEGGENGMAAPQWKGGKCKSVQQAKAFFRHNDRDRRQEGQHTNPHIDKSKTHENFTYRGLSYKSLCKAFDDRLAAVDMGRESTGKNARVVLQSVVLYPPKGLTREQEKDWFMDAGKVLEARYGDDFLEMQVDMDEEHEYTDKDTGEKVMSRNHGHARLFPAVDGQLNGKAFSSSANMRALNHALDVMSVKKYGVPMMDGTKKKGGASVEALKAASLRVEVEQLEQVAETVITDAMDRASKITADANRDARAERRAADDYAYRTRRKANRDAQETADQAEEDAQAIRAAADLDAQRTRAQAERDAQAMREQVAAMRRERDEAQADRDKAREDERQAHQDAHAWAVKAHKLQTAHKATRAALQGDLETWAGLTPKPSATALLGVLGAAVEASRATRPMSPGVGSAMARMMAMVRAQDARRRDAHQDGLGLG